MATYRQIFMTVNGATGKVVDPNNIARELRLTELPFLVYKETAIFCLSFVNSDNTPVVFAADDVFELAVDTNFNHADDLMVYSDGVSIDAAGDWDDIDRAEGKISVRFSANTTSAGTKLGALESVTPYVQVYRTPDGETDSATILSTKCTFYNRVKDSEGTPATGAPEFYNATQVDSKLTAIKHTKGLGNAIRLLGIDDGVAYEAWVKNGGQWTVGAE